MRVIIFTYKKTIRLELVNEILEREDDIAFTYTDMNDNCFKTYNVLKVDVVEIKVRTGV